MFYRTCISLTVPAVVLVSLIVPPSPPAPAGCPSVRQATLYDARRGTAPDAQGWLFYLTGGGQTPPRGSDAATFSTLGKLGFQGGYFRFTPFPLDRRQGFRVLFDLQVLAEKHAGPNRAGVDLIALGDDKKGIELAFWTDQVWAQSDKPLFQHAEGARLATTTGLLHYVLTIHGSTYALTVGGRRILTGPARDYTAFRGSLNPYRSPDCLFLGDDSKSAAGSFRIARVQISQDRR